VKGFVDEVELEVSSGKGGDGAISFRREKYIPRGGPDGGDGGKGGAIVFKVKANVKTLSHLRQFPFIKAEDGKPGRGKRMHGRDGRNAVIYVPPGTVIKSAMTGEVLKDFTNTEEDWVFLEGGKGGKGNWHFRSPTRQTPRFASPGQSGKSCKIVLELKLIADIGLVGLPNAGKSTLLSVLTHARPKIADYPFTTLIPNLGVMQHKGNEIIIADIPGIIEDASKGAGLGLDFLKHIARTRLLIFLIDVSSEHPVRDYQVLMKEIKSYSEGLLARQCLVVLTKIDLADYRPILAQFQNDYPKLELLAISSKTGDGLVLLRDRIIELAGIR